MKIYHFIISRVNHINQVVDLTWSHEVLYNNNKKSFDGTGFAPRPKNWGVIAPSSPWPIQFHRHWGGIYVKNTMNVSLFLDELVYTL